MPQYNVRVCAEAWLNFDLRIPVDPAGGQEALQEALATGVNKALGLDVLEALEPHQLLGRLRSPTVALRLCSEGRTPAISARLEGTDRRAALRVADWDELPSKLFALGLVVYTPAVLRRAEVYGLDLPALLERHAGGDWGDTEHPTENDNAVNNEGRILSVYGKEPAGRVWILTEWNRSATTILCPEDY